MTLQDIINSAQSIEISRPALVATTMSRSGRLFTGTRNWSKPSRITVEPKPIWRIADARGLIESVMTKDKHTEHEIYIGQNGASWLTAYQGDLTMNQVTNLSVDGSSSGTNLVVNLTAEVQALASTTVLFEPGDIVKPYQHRYPYYVTDQVLRGAGTQVNIPLNRGIIPQTSYTLGGKTLQVGQYCSFFVKVGSLPTYRFLPGQFVEFTGSFELIESII